MSGVRRPRRLRAHPALRAMVRETILSPVLIMPVFIDPEPTAGRQLPSMPGTCNHGLEEMQCLAMLSSAQLSSAQLSSAQLSSAQFSMKRAGVDLILSYFARDPGPPLPDLPWVHPGVLAPGMR